MAAQPCKGRHSSIMWQHFERDGDTGFARCHICKEKISFRSTTANLRSHMRRKHVEVYEAVIDTDDVVVPESPRIVAVESIKGDPDDEANAVWSYFEREAGGRGRCVVCRAVVPQDDLKAHLRGRHPKLVAEVDLGTDDEATDSQEDVYTEIVYLEDEQNDKKGKSVQKKKYKPKSTNERSERKRQASSSSDETPLRQKKTKIDDEKLENNDEIEQFGKYVTCLLRKIPPAACMELQAEIINLIMKKQLEFNRNQTSLLAGTVRNKMAGESSRMADGHENMATSSLSLNTINGYSDGCAKKE